MKKMHVITKYFFPVTAGIEVNIQETHKKLKARGYEIYIHTSTDTLTEKNVLSTKPEVIEGLKVQRYPFRWYGFIPKINWQDCDVVSLHNFNIVPHLFIMVYIVFLKITGKKHFTVLLTPHGGFTPEWRIFTPFVSFLKKLYHFSLGAVLINLSIDKIRAVSEWEKHEIVKKGIAKNKVTVVSNGIEDEAFLNSDKQAGQQIKNKVEQFGNYIIQVGRIYMIKNYETTIRALILVSQDIKFVIVGPIGDINYLNHLKKLIKKLGLEQRVFFIGVVRGVDKYYLMKNAQMMVHMAMWESFCNVVHEGMSQGLPCIVADNTALPLLIKNGINGYCVETNDVNGLAEKINYILKNSNSQIIEKMRGVNKKLALFHSWNNVALQLENLLKS